MKRGGKPPQSTRVFYGILAAVFVVGLAVILWIVFRPAASPVVTAADVGPAQAEGYLKGDPNAPVQVIEFGDYACPQCGRWAVLTEPEVMKRLVEPGLISFRYYDLPLDIPGHENSPLASLAAACADEQGQFWPYHDRIYMGYEDWARERNPKGVFVRYARELGLNVDQFEACYDAQKYMGRVLANKAEAQRRGINATPTFIIGQQVVSGAIPYDQFKALVDSALVRARAAAPAGAAAPAAGAPAAGPAR